MLENSQQPKQEAEFLKREEIKTMTRDIAGLREMEAKTEKERIIGLKPAEIKPQPPSVPPTSFSPAPPLPSLKEDKPVFSFPYKKIVVRGIIALFSISLLGFGFWFWQGKKSPEQKTTPREETAPPIQEVLPPKEPEELIQAPIIKERLVTRGFRNITGTRTIDTIIIYSVIKETQDSGTAFHYIVARSNGTIYRLVADNNIAYHAGTGIMPDGARKNTINSFSIGIGLIYGKNDSPNEAQYQSLTDLIKYLRQQYNIPLENVLRRQDISPDKGINPLNFDWEKFNSLIK